MTGFRVTIHAQRAGVNEFRFLDADTVRTGDQSAVAETAGEHTDTVVISHNSVGDGLSRNTAQRDERAIRRLDGVA